MKKALIILFTLVVGVLVGIVLEKHKLTESVYHDAYVGQAESDITHYCGCIEDNPESYNDLLDEVEKINDDLDAATRDFLAQNGLKPFDMCAVLRITRNGNPRMSVWCSNRTPKVTSLFDGYSDVTSIYHARYMKLLNNLHGH
jgi:hypothetical protein